MQTATDERLYRSGPPQAASDTLSDVVLVTGGRNYGNAARVFETLSHYHPKLIIHGACPTGADSFAERWAKANEVNYIGFPAKWKRYGNKAGPYRNQQMIDWSREVRTIDLVIAFPGGAGTADMVRRARLVGIDVIEVQDGETFG